MVQIFARACIGRGFALMEGTLVRSRLLQRENGRGCMASVELPLSRPNRPWRGTPQRRLVAQLLHHLQQARPRDQPWVDELPRGAWSPRPEDGR